MANRLAQETSPYLLQHAENPVDWYPWGEEALELAVEQNKPILLSIGYSSCHWCHVMEHESFENPEIAEVMNRHFICIKVDREERPDLDQIYQNVAQALTQGGGWPLTVFLTPARKPFFGGTYFPPEDRYGRAGFKRVLLALNKAYQTDPIGVAQNAMKLTAYIQRAEEISGEKQEPAGEIGLDQLIRSSELLLEHIDWQNGGIGAAPKFPNAMTFSFLWRFGSLHGNDRARQAVLLTLRKMASGGIYDHLGGGFSRYSVDGSWSVPHFEKMLYDNGLLLKLYSEVLLSSEVSPEISKEDCELFVSVIRGTVQYLLREMVPPEGGFFAAQDADSECEEGKYFVWDLQELEQVLPGASGSEGERDRRIFALRFGVDEGGNFENGKTVLFLARTADEIAQELGLTGPQVSESLERSSRMVFEARRQRVAPGTDNKVLASWNGLAISGLSWASLLLRKEGLMNEAEQALHAAERAFRLVSERMVSGQDGKLSSTFQGGKPKFNAYLDDYAFMAMAALDLARVTQDSQLLSKAIQMSVLWCKRIVRHFSDKKNLGYFFTSDDHEELLHRPKSIFDQAIPSGISVALECMSILSEIDESSMTEFSSEVEKQLFGLLPSAERSPMGCAELMNAALLYRVGPVVVSGSGAEAACVSPYIFRKPPERAKSGHLLVCHKRSCDAPLSNAEELKRAALSKVKI